jgi:ubiquinone biosynthesis protein Coq4
MREVHQELASYWLGGLIEVASVDGGPSDEQLRIIQGLLRGYFGIESTLDLIPLPAAALSEIIVDPGSRLRLVQTMIVLQFARHPASEALAAAVEEYAGALGVDEPMMVVARDAAQHSRELLMADWARFAHSTPTEPQLLTQSEDEFSARIEALHHCPGGSLGRAFIDFYDHWGLELPSSSGEHSVSLVTHDFAHVLSGYRPNDAVDEVALSAMLVSMTDGGAHFSALTASMALYEVDLFEILEIAGTKGVLDRLGAPAVFADAMRRGASCTADIATVDHLALAGRPLEEIRSRLGITPRAA